MPKPSAVVAAGIMSFFIGVGAFGMAKDAATPLRKQVIEDLVVPPVALPQQEENFYWHETRFERGDTFASMLQRLGVEGVDTTALIKQNGSKDPLRYLRPGTSVQAKTNEDGQLLTLRFMGAGRDMLVGYDRIGGRLRPVEEPAQITRRTYLKSGQIRGSLFAAADAADMPDSIMTHMVRIFSGYLDFHRDLRPSDRFAVVYEVFYHDGQPLRTGRVLAAEFVNDRTTYRAVWFGDADGKGAYYTPEGRSLRRPFLRSPLEFSRIASGFANRLHPIFRDWRSHKGVDYSAPIGTGVRATADGVVEFSGNKNGYGNVIILKHHSGITTLYAHLNAYGANIRKGIRVSQGDTIGYVGATGWATGPHLHYEFRVNDEHRDPLAPTIPTVDTVPPRLGAAFRAEARALTTQLDLAARVNIAGLE